MVGNTIFNAWQLATLVLFLFFLSGFASAFTGGVKIYHIIREAFK